MSTVKKAQPLALPAPDPSLKQKVSANHRSWDAKATLATLARSWQEIEPGIRRTPDELEATLMRTQWPSNAVLERCAEHMHVPVEQLVGFLSERPWQPKADVAPPDFMSDGQKRDQMQRIWGRFGLTEFDYQPNAVTLDTQVRRARISDAQLGVISHFSNGMMTAGDFEAAFKKRSGTPATDGLRGYVLSPTRVGTDTDIRFAERYNLRHFKFGYDRHFSRRDEIGPQNNIVPRPTEYLDYITSSGEPVVFLVPPNGMNEHTRDEFDWLMQNPHRMKNVTFVFGAFAGQ